MTKCVTVDERERIRATRVEVARLLALPFREKLNDFQYWLRNRLLLEHIKTLPQADRESFEEYLRGNHGADLDWSILDEDGVSQAVESAVCDVMARFPDKPSATVDDLTQSARIILAERAKFARSLLRRGLLRRWLGQQLGHLVRYERVDRSLEAMVEATRTNL